MTKYYLKLDDLEEITIRDHGKTLRFWIPRVVICGDCLYKRRRLQKYMSGNFGAVFPYDAIISENDRNSVCIKVTDEEALCDGTDLKFRVNGICPNAGSGEIYSKVWTTRVDPEDELFVTRFSAADDSLIACWVDESKELNACLNAKSVEEVCKQNAGNDHFSLYHFTVMECYDGNAIDLMRSFENTDDARQKAETLAFNVFKLLTNTLYNLEKYGFFYKDMSLWQIVFKKENNDKYKLRLVDFANISTLRVETRASNYGALVPPAYKKIICKKNKKFLIDGNAWFDVSITEDGLLYQVAFVILQILSSFYGYQDFFRPNHHPFMYYDGPYDKHTKELQSLVAHIKSLVIKKVFIREETLKMIDFCVNILETQLTIAQKQTVGFL